MIKRIKYIVLACTLAGTVLPSMSVQATESQNNRDMAGFSLRTDIMPSYQRRSARHVQFAQQRQQRKISPSQAKSIALRRHPGAQFINISLRGNTYRVRLKLNNGRIIDVSVDARAR